jgi:hypothetical protein
VLLIVEEPSWAEAAAQFGGLQNVDAALEPIVEALTLNPAGFPEVDPVNLPGIRLAKTDEIQRADVIVVPALRVWFRYRVGDDRWDCCSPRKYHSQPLRTYSLGVCAFRSGLVLLADERAAR